MFCRIREDSDILLGASKHIITPGSIVSLDVNELKNLRNGSVQIRKGHTTANIQVSCLEFIEAENLNDIIYLEKLAQKISRHKKLILIDESVGMCHVTFPTFGDNLFIYPEECDPEFIDPQLENLTVKEFADRVLFWKFAQDVASERYIDIYRITLQQTENKYFQLEKYDAKSENFRILSADKSIEKLVSWVSMASYISPWKLHK